MNGIISLTRPIWTLIDFQLDHDFSDPEIISVQQKNLNEGVLKEVNYPLGSPLITDISEALRNRILRQHVVENFHKQWWGKMLKNCEDLLGKKE